MRALFFVGIAAASLLGCRGPKDARHPEDAVETESGGRHEPQSAAERKLLERLAHLPEGVKEKVDDQTMSASGKYHAASGYSCRAVTLEKGGERSVRLACGDKRGWFFVPDIYQMKGASAGASSSLPEPVVHVSATGEATVVSSPSGATPPSQNSRGAAPEEEGL